MARKHIHPISPEKDWEECKENEEDEGKNLRKHFLFSFSDNLITADRPMRFLIIRFFLHHCDREKERIESNENEEKPDEICEELWICNNDATESQTEESEVRHK